MRTTSISRQSSMVAELKALRSEYAAAQQRCSATIGQLHARNLELEAELIRLRAAVAARDTALQWAKEDRLRLLATLPGLPTRLKLAGRLEALGARVQALLRQLLRLEAQIGRQAEPAPALAASSPVHTTAETAGTGPSGVRRSAGVQPFTVSASPAPVSADARRLSADSHWDEDEAALEERLDEADLVICQTGCLSHEAYWRMQDHCRRHNKPCVLVEQPDAVRVIRIHQRSESVVPATMAGASCSGTNAEAGGMLDTTMSAVAIENVDADGAGGQPVVRPPTFRPDER